MRLLVYVWLTALVAALLFFSVRAYGEAKSYEDATAQQIAKMNPKSLAEYRLKEWAETLSLGYYRNGEKQILQRLQKVRETHRRESKHYVLKALFVLLLLCGSAYLVSLRTFTFIGALGAAMMLFFGLITPILMVTIHKHIDYLGDVVLSFESKSIMGSLVKLYENGDVTVAIVVLLFSVLIPLVKTFALMFVALFLRNRFAHGMVAFFKMIGKWSMVDVFVVATFLVYLTADKGDVSRAEAESGLYFFLTYVIVSMLVSLSADKMLHRKQTA